MLTPGKRSALIRQRFNLLVDAVDAAKELLGLPASSVPEDLVWRLLFALWVHQCRLEDDLADRTHCVQRLRATVSNQEQADALFEALVALAARWAKEGGRVDLAVLRAHLSGRILLSKNPLLSTAWALFEQLGDALTDRARPELLIPSRKQPLQFERQAERARVLACMNEAIARRGGVVVTGAPGVGKSALAVDLAKELEGSGAWVLKLSLRDVASLPTLQFESLLRTKLRDVFSGGPSVRARLILLDGAEVVQEGAGQLVEDVAREAFRAGVAVVAVARSDAGEVVARALQHAVRTARPDDCAGGIVARTEVEGLSDGEIAALLAAVPALERIATHPGSRWLLGRPGWVRLILESDAAGSLPDGPLCEAAVFSLIWFKLVRADDRERARGVSAEGRAATARALARRLLLPADPSPPPPLDPDAITALRQDGVLLPVRPGLIWQTRAEFASDLLRDVVVTIVLLEGWPGLLNDAGVPNWALLAARVAFQSLLLEEVDQWALPEQLAFARGLQRGDRWADLPFEAALGLPDAAAVLTRAKPQLLERGAHELAALMRVLTVRFEALAGLSPHAGAAVVSLLCDVWPELARVAPNVIEKAEDVVLGWLQGLAFSVPAGGPHVLRQRVRDELVLPLRRHSRDWDVACLGVMGEDLNAAGVERLLALSTERPERLRACVEEPAAALSMSKTRCDLLLALSEAYYIEADDDGQRRARSSPMDDGVRNHRPQRGPLSAWYFGSFVYLLQAEPRKALALIHRLLEHAVAVRAEGEGRNFVGRPAPGAAVGLELDLAGLGPRKYLGDAPTWGWYRALGTGPYPCMSALMALDRSVDQWVGAGADFRQVVQLLLAGAATLPMAGMVYGLAVRHFEHDPALVEGWLAEPAVWDVDTDRVLHERLSNPFRDPPMLVNEARRAWRPMDVAAFAAGGARLAGDDARQSRLASLAERLLKTGLERAAADIGGAGVASSDPSGDEVTILRRRAAMLDSRNYQEFVAGDKRGIEFVEPPDIATALEVGRRQSARCQELYRLLHAYGADAPAPPKGPDLQMLLSDLDLAEDLLADPPAGCSLPIVNGPAAVASFALREHLAGRAQLPPGKLGFCLETLLRPDIHEWSDMMPDVSLHSSGPDREAARVVPSLLLSGFDWDAVGTDHPSLRNRTLAAAEKLATSSSLETTSVFFDAVTAVGTVACSGQPGLRAPCRHRLAFSWAVASARVARVAYDAARGPRIKPIRGDLIAQLPKIRTEDLVPPRLELAIAGISACAASADCLAQEALNLLPPLRAAWARAMDPESYAPVQVTEQHVRSVMCRALLRLSQKHGPASLLAFVDGLREGPAHLAALLDGLCLVATYEAWARPVLAGVWPALMEQGLKVYQGGWRTRVPDFLHEHFLAALMPAPQFRLGEGDIDTLLRSTEQGWIPASILERQIGQWLSAATARVRCLTSLVFFINSQSSDDQSTFGIPWICGLVEANPAQFAGRSGVVVDWLGRMIEMPGLTARRAGMVRRVVDGLAAHGDRRALDLQKSLEIRGK